MLFASESEELVWGLVDLAELTPMVTESGLVRTRALYRVGNRTEQFPKLRMPREAGVWAVTVRGAPSKPGWTRRTSGS